MVSCITSCVTITYLASFKVLQNYSAHSLLRTIILEQPIATLLSPTAFDDSCCHLFNTVVIFRGFCDATVNEAKINTGLLCSNFS